MPAQSSIYEDQYDVVAGHWPAGSHELVLVLDEDGIDAGHDWDGVNRGAWDAEARTFTLELLGGTEPLTLTVPDRIRGAGRDGELAVEERAFAVALRQRITAAIIHPAGRALPRGRRATASVRRRADGSLYSVTDPPLGEDGALDADDVDALLALERRVRDGVGLTTS